MKVIGTTKEGYQNAYIAIVTHDELCAVMNKSNYRDNTLPELKPGQDFDLKQGYDFRREITDATRQMTAAYEKFAKVAPIAAEFAGIVAAKAGEAGSVSV